MTVEQIRKAIGIIQRRIDALTDFRPEGEVMALLTSIVDGLARAFGIGTGGYEQFYFGVTRWRDGEGCLLYNKKRTWARAKATALFTLNDALRFLKESIADEASADAAPASKAEVAIDTDHIFIVHGHDGEVKNAIARFIAALGLKPVILDEQANRGRTVIEKFEDHSRVGFAVVLLTPDDTGGVAGGPLRPRARQNAVLELGFFVGRLGRNRVCAVVRGPDIEV